MKRYLYLVGVALLVVMLAAGLTGCRKEAAIRIAEQFGLGYAPSTHDRGS